MRGCVRVGSDVARKRSARLECGTLREPDQHATAARTLAPAHSARVWRHYSRVPCDSYVNSGRSDVINWLAKVRRLWVAACVWLCDWVALLDREVWRHLSRWVAQKQSNYLASSKSFCREAIAAKRPCCEVLLKRPHSFSGFQLLSWTPVFSFVVSAFLDALFKQGRPEVAHKLGKLLWLNSDQRGLKLVTKYNETGDRSQPGDQRHNKTLDAKPSASIQAFLRTPKQPKNDQQSVNNIEEIARQSSRARFWITFFAVVVFLSLFAAVSMLCILCCPSFSYLAVSTFCSAIQTLCGGCYILIKQLCCKTSTSDPYYDPLDFDYETI